MTTATAEPLFDTGLKPLRNTVIVKRLDPKDVTTPAGVIIPGQFREKSIEAWVIAAGPGRHTKKGKLIPTAVKPGDRILIDRIKCTDIGVKGRRLVLLDDRSILAIIHDDRG